MIQISEIESKVKELLSKKNSLERVVKEKDSEGKKLENELDEINKEIENEKHNLFDNELYIQKWDKQKFYLTKKSEELNREFENLNNKLNDISNKKSKIQELTNGTNLEKEIEKNEELIQDLTAQKSNILALLKEAKKSVEDLSKVSSKCPICETNLAEERKSQIVGHRRSHIEQLNKEENEFSNKISELITKLSLLKKNLHEVNKLNAECINENEIISKKNNIEKEIQEIKKDLENNEIKEKLTAKTVIEQKITTLQDNKIKLKNNLTEFRSQNVFEEYAKLNDQIEDSMNSRLDPVFGLSSPNKAIKNFSKGLPPGKSSVLERALSANLYMW